MEECIFCKIVRGELPHAVIWEDEDFLAILDAFPNTRGMTLVITKKHYDSYIFDMPAATYSKYLLVTRNVAQLLEKGLKVQRVGMVMEGMGINHAHIKLYPMHGLDKKFVEMWANERVFFEKYEGFLETKPGEKADMEELKKLAQEIKNN